MDAQTVVDALPDGVVVAGAGGEVRLVSRVAATMLGTDPATAVGSPLGEVLALSDHEGNTWVGTNAPYDGLATRTGVPEQSWLLPTGTEVLVAARISRPALDRPVDHVAVTLRSGRGRERLDRERSDLVATVAHELRSPLTGVKGFVQAMLNRWDRLNDEQKKLMLTTVAADSDRLSRLIAELLDVARIDTGRLQMHARPVDAAQLVARIVESVAAGTARTITWEVTGELPRVHADPDKFTQVFTNLVENGVRHGDGDVAVLLQPLGPDDPDALEGGGVRIVVTDRGEGIPVELRRQVFTKFWKGGERGGSGLGLYIVGGLTRAHGGTVTIDDAPGGGARIAVIWPAERDPL
ncbi:PAS domain-containing sensor histidine kinase [Nocardioides sp. SYSU D00038]|uniref:sensor histidine kinase n=1 Tax=Nocardioides sp. SYSU D00038 TaxID=2812554 RepID=UPI0019679DA5|nr:PAS domain-containing sensor histidine kinase [Nocardioides sp. SYSU D00038]